MKVFFTRKTLVIIIVALAIAGITLVSVNTAGNGGIISNIASVVSKPLKGIASSVADMFESIYGNMYKYDNLVDENEELRKRIMQLEEEYREYTDIAAENARLRELQGFDERHAGNRKEEAYIIQPSASNWSSRFTINLGYDNSQIAVGNCVITETGALVGRVVSVEPTTATCISVIDTTFSAHALIGDGGGEATATGDFSLMHQGMLKLDYIQQDAIAVHGDSLVTSGKNGILPSGLLIGTIEELYDNPSGIDRYATVRPVVDINSVSVVYVIYSFDITE